MPQYLPLPDGSTVTIREGETPQQAYARAQQMYPEAFKTAAPAAPKEGLIAGFQKGAESTLSQMRSGLGALVGSGDEAAKAGLARG